MAITLTTSLSIYIYIYIYIQIHHVKGFFTPCLGFLGGILVELYGNRAVAIVGTLVAAVGFIATVFATRVGHLFVTFSVLTGNAKHARL